MRNFVVFAGANYYPTGGFFDFVASFKNFEAARKEAEAVLKVPGTDWSHVVDVKKGEFVWRSDAQRKRE